MQSSDHVKDGLIDPELISQSLDSYTNTSSDNITIPTRWQEGNNGKQARPQR